MHDQVKDAPLGALRTSVGAGEGVQPGYAGRKILIGPSYMREIESIDWKSATVRFLRKQKSTSDDAACGIYYDLASMKEAIAGEPVEAGLAEVILELNRDTNCFLLAERERGSLFDGALLAPVSIANCARYAWLILRTFDPAVLVFHNLPHELFTYVLSRVALRRAIPTLLVHYSVLPWRMRVSKYSTDGSTTRVRISEEVSEAQRTSITRYMARLQASHESAIPFTDRAFVSANRSALQLRNEFGALMKGQVLKNVLRIVKKLHLYRGFKRLVADEAGTPYVVFLLHYQPEETTIPRGGAFSQQLNAILKLRSMLPVRTRILVKEHMATFRLPLSLAISARSHDFYQAIASMPATHLVPMARDTFELVDNSLAVATITGSVGLEALCRGKKVIVFGDANYKNFSGVIRLDTVDVNSFDLSAALDAPVHDPSTTKDDLIDELHCSIGRMIEDNELNFRSQQAATIESFEYVAHRLDELLSDRACAHPAS